MGSKRAPVQFDTMITNLEIIKIISKLRAEIALTGKPSFFERVVSDDWLVGFVN